MLDRFLESPLLALGFILLVVYLAGLYFTNRARAKVAQMKGPPRFQPDWNKNRGGRRRRKPTRGGGFSPQWSSKRRDSQGASKPADAPEDAETHPETPVSRPETDR